MPEVDEEEIFGAAELRQAERYERFVRVDFLVSQVVVLAVLGAYARFGRRFARESAAGRIGTGMLVGMLGLGILWLALLPFGLAELWWERKHGVSSIGYVDWVLGAWFALGGEFLFLCLALFVAMGLAGPLRERWWIPGAAVFVAISLLFTFVDPYLAGGERLRDPALAQDAEELSRAQGLPEIPVYVQPARTFTTAPNAEATGLGPSRRVILWDTLLTGGFQEDEVRFVLAHELAHHARDHPLKGVAWYALFAFPGAFVIARATRRRGGLRSPAAVPLALFIFVVLSTVAAPMQNAVIRHLEEEADWVALETTRDPDAASDGFRRLVTALRAEPSPPTWSYVLMETHPSFVERIAMAEAAEERQRP